METLLLQSSKGQQWLAQGSNSSGQPRTGQCPRLQFRMTAAVASLGQDSVQGGSSSSRQSRTAAVSRVAAAAGSGQPRTGQCPGWRQQQQAVQDSSSGQPRTGQCPGWQQQEVASLGQDSVQGGSSRKWTA
ncbi:uncharacterized protein LOC121879935 isoform X2 [Homarus americanus]|uniref:uncharacterized protein LOC121879935 isoform X2 n=1 Tax=Homarus americanus TaxID=6706 RepID=UPI001C438E27|nr:uncharacterized protein LOC121879935 isoform X2 [Homarus americanus]